MSAASTPTANAGPQVVRLHKGLYMQQAIREAIDSFADFARFELGRDSEHYIVTVHDPGPEVDGDLVAEFCNHALHHTIERKRVRPA